MSAALQLPVIWGATGADAVWTEIRNNKLRNSVTRPCAAPPTPTPHPEPDSSLAFYRKHTESMLRRYLYASSMVGRAPQILRDSVGRGWISSRPVRTFEDAVIFVLDMEKCLAKLSHVEQQLLSRIVLQEYTHPETADMLGLAVRTVSYKFPQALDRLTRILLDAGLLVLPH